jgi:SAM-dependent methyltransferase
VKFKKARIFAYFLLNVLHYAIGYFLKIIGIIDFPLPPNSSLRKTAATNYFSFYISGIGCFSPIETSALREGLDLNGKINVLDFGCGVGRQMMFFTRKYPQASYYACDIDSSSVRFIEKNYPQVKAYANDFNPPLKYEDGFFDMIYSVSIFSHLTIEDQEAWLKELARIVKPGGYCFLTTEGMTAFKALKRRELKGDESIEKRLNEQGYIYKEYEHLEIKDTFKSIKAFEVFIPLAGVEGSYGNTLYTPKYIRENWVRHGFEVVDILEGVIDSRQDLVVLKRARETGIVLA